MAIIIKIIYLFYTIFHLFILLSIYFNLDISKLFSFLFVLFFLVDITRDSFYVVTSFL